MKKLILAPTLLACIILSFCTKKNNLNNVPQNNKTYNVVDFGALNDTTKFSTTGIQAAIDACNQNGGGTVVIPAGNYKTLTIQLKSNVTLSIQSGATLWGDPDMYHYTKASLMIFADSNLHGGLIVAINATNISLIGPGNIDGQGGSPSFFTRPANNHDIRPRIIEFMNCTNVTVQNVNLRNAAFWTQYYLGCNGVILDNINVNTFSNSNNDGFDIDSQNVKVTNCTVNSGDDGMCLKSNYTQPCSNVEISNCTISSDANGIKLGTGSTTGFKNIYIHDCTVKAPPVSPFLNFSTITSITNPITVISGLALEVVDGGVMDSIKVDNINMSGIMNPLSIWLGDRSRQNPDKQGNPGVLQNVWISNITAVNVTTRMSSSITGNKYTNKTLNQPVYQVIKNVNLSNISFTSPGNSTSLDTTLASLEPEGGYPEIIHLSPKIPNTKTIYSTLPSYGLFIRHVKGVTITNANLNYLANDLRPVFYLEDVQDLTANGIAYKQPTGNGPLIKAKDTSNVRIKFNN